MENNIEISPAPNFWDGESAFLMQDTNGNVHILQESGNPVEIAERKYQEAREARKIRRSAK
jgi:hypothetical protein